jgi:hypothetical protein
MRYLKLFESFMVNLPNWLIDDIDSICSEYKITNYTINEDGSIDVRGDVSLSYKGLTELPLEFRNVKGNFSCSSNQLTSLEGCPKSVGGDFDCYDNQLTSLVGTPQSVGGDFDCYSNWLETLEGVPQSIGGSFNCDNNRLKTLDGCPKSVGGFHCHNNPCYPIYEEWIDTDRRDELLDMMKDYDFLRGDKINWYLLEAFFEDAGLEIPDREELEEDYIIEE